MTSPGVIQAGASDPKWLVGEHIRATGYLYRRLVFWMICFAMSRYSVRLERQLLRGNTMPQRSIDRPVSA